jgi:hypothetical protein
MASKTHNMSPLSHVRDKAILVSSFMAVLLMFACSSGDTDTNKDNNATMDGGTNDLGAVDASPCEPDWTFGYAFLTPGCDESITQQPRCSPRVWDAGIGIYCDCNGNTIYGGSFGLPVRWTEYDGTGCKAPDAGTDAAKTQVIDAAGH